MDFGLEGPDETRPSVSRCYANGIAAMRRDDRDYQNPRLAVIRFHGRVARASSIE